MDRSRKKKFVNDFITYRLFTDDSSHGLTIPIQQANCECIIFMPIVLHRDIFSGKEPVRYLMNVREDESMQRLQASRYLHL